MAAIPKNPTVTIEKGPEVCLTVVAAELDPETVTPLDTQAPLEQEIVTPPPLAAALEGAEPKVCEVAPVVRSIVEAAEDAAAPPVAVASRDAIDAESTATRARADETTGPALSVWRIDSAALYSGLAATEFSKFMMDV
jgi:hypothetical protein